MDIAYVFFFFFQAEDGIRDYKVTGVQTCALPIYGQHRLAERRAADELLQALDQRHDQPVVEGHRAALGRGPAEQAGEHVVADQPQSGRAACRGRGENSGGAGSLKKKKKKKKERVK